MSQLRSGNQAAQPQGSVPQHHGQPCSHLGQGTLQAPTAEEDASCDLGCPQEQILLFQSKGGSVCWGRGSACVLSHGQPAPSGLGSKAASTSQPPTISKELSSLLQSKSKQNTTTDAVCKTKPYLSWDLRTHTKLPASGRASGGTTTVNGYISGGAKELWGQPDCG